uniref:Uncharacterized protein n=1 Tax=Romanomermis culicivorax TaxID=13658 RepID=A0A915J8Q6_ROMCU
MLFRRNHLCIDPKLLFDYIFLGGSCGATTWRKDFVIPYLKSAGISYFNPQRATWTEDMIKIEERAKNNSRLLLFVVDSSQPSLISLVEIAFLAARNAPLIVVLPTESELAVGPIKDPKHDRLNSFDFLRNALRRHNIPVYRQIADALKIVSDRICAHRLRNPRSQPQSFLSRCVTCIKSCICHFMACLLVLPLYNRQPKESSEFLPSTSTERCQALTLLLFSLFAQMSFYYASQLIFTDSSVFLHQCIYWCGVEGLLSCTVSSIFECLRSQDSTLDCLQTKLPVRRKPSCRNTFDVYLIGCGTDYNWMRYNVIPQLNQNKVTYYDSFLQDFDQRVSMIKSCTIVLVVIASVDNIFSGIVELAYYTGSGSRTIGCFFVDIPVLSDEVLAPLNDYYRRGIMYLKDMAQEFGDLLLVQNLKFALDQTIFEILNISDDMSDQET